MTCAIKRVQNPEAEKEIPIERRNDGMAFCALVDIFSQPLKTLKVPIS